MKASLNLPVTATICWETTWWIFILLILPIGPVEGAGMVPLPSPEPSAAHPGFHRLGPDVTGITFRHSIPPARHQTNQMLLDGSGVALGDVNGDGRVDLFLAATDGGSQLWLNEGLWKFRNVTPEAFPPTDSLVGDVTGAAFADLNGDGALDLVLNSHADGVRVLINNGHAVFRRLDFPQSSARGGHSVALADVDGDGWVDLYVCNYRQRALMDMPNARATFSGSGASRTVATLDGRPTTEPDLTNRFILNAVGGMEEQGEPDVLYRNRGGTNFLEVSWTGGAFLDEDGSVLKEPPRDWGLAAQFCDVNGDGRPDLYVCDDFHSPDRFWLNEGSPGTIRFRLVPRDVLRHTSLFSMGVDFGDINRDGLVDFMVVDMLSPDHVRRMTMLDGTSSVLVNPSDPLARPQSDANTLFLQRRDGSFAEVAAFAGVTATDWSWTPAFLDVDLDGWLDLLVTAGQERGSRDLDVAESMKAFRRSGLRTDAQIFRERQKFPRLPARLQAYRNRGVSASGSIPTFVESGPAWGLDFVGVSHGLALGDLDGDGDLDLVVNHLNEPAGLYRNDAPGPRIMVHLKGRPPNTAALGARMRFGWGTDPEAALREQPQSAQVFAGGRYLSSDEFTRVFACPGPGRGVLEVRWPSGGLLVLTNLAANQRIELEEPTSSVEGAHKAAAPRLRFESVLSGLSSAASAVDDFSIQPLLPRRLSTRTPLLALQSTPGAGRTLWIGGASGQPLRSAALQGVRVEALRDFGPVGPTTAMAILGDELLVADSAVEGGSGSQGPVFQQPSRGGDRVRIPTRVIAPSALAVTVSQPGKASWLFVGGGPIPGNYPASAPSEILRRPGDQWISHSITNLGLVTGAVFADLDGDGRDELILSAEWTAPQIRRERGGVWERWDAPVKLASGPSIPMSALAGWWQSVAATDLDGDGRADVVLGNWGLNSPYALLAGTPSRPGGGVRPLVLFHGGEGDAPAGVCLEAYTAPDQRLLPIRSRTDMASFFPGVTERFATHGAYARATAQEVLGGSSMGRHPSECRWMASVILLNRGDHFELRDLPDEAQLGPVMALATADFDGDGRRDLFCAQGFFGHGFGMPREDAGEGVFLLGRGDGSFDAVPSAGAGIRLLGEQRAVVAGDLDGDGRPDLVLGVHGGPVTFLLNRRP